MVSIEQLKIGSKVQMTNDVKAYDSIYIDTKDIPEVVGNICTVAEVCAYDFKIEEDGKRFYYDADCIERVLDVGLTDNDLALLNEGDTVRIVDDPDRLTNHFIDNPEDYCGKEFTIRAICEYAVKLNEDPDDWWFHSDTIACVTKRVKRVKTAHINYRTFSTLVPGDKVTLVKRINSSYDYDGGVTDSMRKNFGKQVTIKWADGNAFKIENDSAPFTYDYRLIASIDEHNEPSEHITKEEFDNVAPGDVVTLVERLNPTYDYHGGIVDDMRDNLGKQVTVHELYSNFFNIKEDLYTYDYRLIAKVDKSASTTTTDDYVDKYEHISVDELLKLNVGDKVLIATKQDLDKSTLYVNSCMKEYAGKWLQVCEKPWKKYDENYARVRLADDDGDTEWYWSNEMIVQVSTADSRMTTPPLAKRDDSKVVMDKEDFDTIMRILKKYGGD